MFRDVAYEEILKCPILSQNRIKHVDFGWLSRVFRKKDYLWLTSVTHPEIKRLILENYPSAKVILLDEIGIAGPYPAPGVVRKQKENFQKSLKEMGVDAARNKVQTMPGGAYATIKIELPANWDSLMAELGYEPLERYLTL